MPQQNSIYAQAINIRLHEHEDADYAALIEHVYRSRIRVNYRSTDYLMISNMYKDHRDETIYRGSIARFVEIDRDGDWLNLETGEKADDDLLQQINIPESLFPNLSTFYFRFDTKIHLLTFEAYGRYGSLSPNSVRKFFETALKEHAVTEQFGHSEVTVVADHNDIDELFEFDRLTKIRIVIERPNDIGSDDMEKDVLEELEKENARKLERQTTAVPGGALTPIDKTVALAKVAARNGLVETRGQQGDSMQDRSTIDIPLREGHRYDPNAQTEESAFDVAADEVVKRFKTK